MIRLKETAWHVELETNRNDGKPALEKSTQKCFVECRHFFHKPTLNGCFVHFAAYKRFRDAFAMGIRMVQMVKGWFISIAKTTLLFRPQASFVDYENDSLETSWKSINSLSTSNIGTLWIMIAKSFEIARNIHDR